MSTADTLTTLSPKERALKIRFALLWKHLAIRVIVIAIVLTAAFLATRWQPVYWLLIPAGILGQMLSEYLIHRFIFHLPPPRRQFWFNVLYLCHYGHHDFPTKPGLFFVPIWFALPMLLTGLAVYTLVFWLLGFPNAAEMALAMGLIGHGIAFLGYEWYHMTAHLNIRKFAPERRVTRLHNLHHFKDYGRNFHVSFGGEVIDKTLGTALSDQDREALERRNFIRTIGLDPGDARLVAARAQFAEKIGISEAEQVQARRGSKLGAGPDQA